MLAINDTIKTAAEEDTFTPVENPIKDLEFIGLHMYDEIEGHRVEDLTFEEWNQKQLPKNRIHHPTAFTMVAPKIIFDKIEAGSAIDEKGQPVSFKFSKMKEDKGHGRQVSILVTSPACISQRGFRENDTSTGKIKSTGAILDMSNPQHRHFWEVTCMGIINQFVEFMMTSPGTWDLKFKAVTADTDKSSKKYIDAFKSASESMSTIVRYPKIGEEFDTESNIRMIFINPMNYVDKTDPKKSSFMKTYLPHQKEPITQDEIELICQGWEVNPETGKIFQGKPKGFEFSFSWLFSRGVRTSKNSVQPKGTAMYIHRIFDAPEFESKDSRHMKTVEESISEDFSRFVGVSGFKKNEEAQPSTAMVNFIPMSTAHIPLEEKSTLPPLAIEAAAVESEENHEKEISTPVEPVPSLTLRSASGSSLQQITNFGGSSVEQSSQPAGQRTNPISFAKFGGRAFNKPSEST